MHVRGSSYQLLAWNSFTINHYSRKGKGRIPDSEYLAAFTLFYYFFFLIRVAIYAPWNYVLFILYVRGAVTSYLPGMSSLSITIHANGRIPDSEYLAAFTLFYYLIFI